MMSSKKSKISRMARLLGTLSLAALLLYACDSLEEDVLPDEQKVTTEGTKLYTLANNAAYISLYALVKTQEPVQLKINSQPGKGSLTEFDKGVLQYSPDASFQKGSDGFGFSVFTLDNRLLLQDSVIIIVENDSTQLPCGLYTQIDYVGDSIQGSVIIDVLKNDVLCDSAHIRLEIYKPSPSSSPAHGTAVVVEKKIKYTPGASFTGSDKIIYKITSTLDSSKFSYGQVHIATRQFKLVNDYYIFGKDTLTSSPITLSVFQNDSLYYGNGASYTASILAAPNHATVTVNGMISLSYALSATPAALTDSLTYQVCRGVQCKTAKVYIRIN